MFRNPHKKLENVKNAVKKYRLCIHKGVHWNMGKTCGSPAADAYGSCYNPVLLHFHGPQLRGAWLQPRAGRRENTASFSSFQAACFRPAVLEQTQRCWSRKRASFTRGTLETLSFTCQATSWRCVLWIHHFSLLVHMSSSHWRDKNSPNMSNQTETNWDRDWKTHLVHRLNAVSHGSVGFNRHRTCETPARSLGRISRLRKHSRRHPDTPGFCHICRQSSFSRVLLQLILPVCLFFFFLCLFHFTDLKMSPPLL